LVAKLMARAFVVSLKASILRNGNEIIRRMLFGCKVTEVLFTELPHVSLRRADLVVPTKDGALHQIEFQASRNTVHLVDFDANNWLVPDRGASGSGPKGIATHFSLHTSGIPAV